MEISCYFKFPPPYRTLPAHWLMDSVYYICTRARNIGGNQRENFEVVGIWLELLSANTRNMNSQGLFLYVLKVSVACLVSWP